MAAIIYIHHRHCYYYSARRLILILPSHGRWKAESTSRPRQWSKGVQPVPEAVYRSSCRDKHNRPQCDSNLDPLTPQSNALTTRPLRPASAPRTSAYASCGSPQHPYNVTHTHTHTHPFNGPFSGTARVNRYQKGKTNLDFTEARDSEWQCHQLGHMQVCASLQTENTPAPRNSSLFL